MHIDGKNTFLFKLKTEVDICVINISIMARELSRGYVGG